MTSSITTGPAEDFFGGKGFVFGGADDGAVSPCGRREIEDKEEGIVGGLDAYEVRVWTSMEG
jgi:hypothetical protein